MKEETVQAATVPSRAQSAPPEQLEKLFQDHYQPVYRTAYRLTGSAVDAEDVLQTVFLRLVKRQGDVQLTPNPGAYLHRAAINASLDLIRQRKRTGLIPLDDLKPELLSPGQTSPEAQQVDQELHQQVQKAIALLGERAAQVFVLRYLEGYDNREIARLLGMSQVVVAVTLHRARTRVRQEIRSYLEEQDETK